MEDVNEFKLDVEAFKFDNNVLTLPVKVLIEDVNVSRPLTSFVNILFQPLPLTVLFKNCPSIPVEPLTLKYLV